tara:strand:- start:321 stop:1505 length:1185 start_codon:yes stop_codon:yes gene_type:complete
MCPIKTNNDAVVIIGAGFGGLSAALTLSHQKDKPNIILIDPKEKFVFTPLLYELLSHEMMSWEIAPTYVSLTQDAGINFIQDSVISINTQDKIVQTKQGKVVSYSKLLISTGSKINDFDIPGVSEFASQFKSLNDVKNLSSFIDEINIRDSENKDLVIVGAGSSGVELACKVSDMTSGKINIILLESNDIIMNGSKFFNREIALKELKKRGVKVYLKTEVKEVKSDVVSAFSIQDLNSSHSLFKYKMLIWTAGVKPEIPEITPQVNTERGRIIVDQYLKLIGSESVFAIGDVSSIQGKSLPQSAQVASQQGNLVAKNIYLSLLGKSLSVFKYVDYGEMLSLGVENASLTGLGITLSGSIAFKIRRAAYTSKFLNPSLAFRSASSWLISSLNYCD